MSPTSVSTDICRVSPSLRLSLEPPQKSNTQAAKPFSASACA